MTTPGDLMVPATDREILDQAHILVLRGVQDTLKRIEQNVRDTDDKVTDVRERLIKIEVEDTKSRVVELASQLERKTSEVFNRLNILETDKNKRDGQAGMITWIATNWPFLVALAGMLWYMQHH